MTELVRKIRRKLRVLGEFASLRGVVFFAQRRVQGPKARDRLSGFVARFLPLPAFLRATPTKAAVALENEGFAMLDGIITPQMAVEMRDYITRQAVRGGYLDEQKSLSILDPELPDTHVLSVVEDGLMSCPYLLDIANHPEILATVEGIFGCKPTPRTFIATTTMSLSSSCSST
jgi:hypothetical protein